MAGGLLGLLAYGTQDVYLTQEPKITFFKIPYRGKNSTDFNINVTEPSREIKEPLRETKESLREIKQPLNFKKSKVENKLLNTQSLMTDLLDIKQRFEKNINKNEIIDMNKIPSVT
jgi:hypothetical protein